MARSSGIAGMGAIKRGLSREDGYLHQSSCFDFDSKMLSVLRWRILFNGIIFSSDAFGV